MTDKIDTSDAQCALVCMIVSNPGGKEQPTGWKKRVNDVIRALQKERNELVGLKDKLTRREMQLAAAQAVSDALKLDNEQLSTSLKHTCSGANKQADELADHKALVGKHSALIEYLKFELTAKIYEVNLANEVIERLKAQVVVHKDSADKSWEWQRKADMMELRYDILYRGMTDILTSGPIVGKTHIDIATRTLNDIVKVK